ncbi:hypothetical protein GGR58DRAFT_288033 [Xylaria digitata]|nr:hypothetical protein GGR58DRAFT_288033 [Xylaria digitata]
MPHWNQYQTFFQDYFAWLASATVYIAVGLTAMQVGLATKSLADSDAFQSASYGFTVFSILRPLISAGLIILVFCCIFLTRLYQDDIRICGFHSTRVCPWLLQNGSIREMRYTQQLCSVR